MAFIRQRGDSGKWQVRWRDADADGKETSEQFTSKEQANVFRGLVDANRQRWPQGWVPGRGFVTEPTQGVGLTLREFFPVAIAARPGASADLKKRYLRQFERYVPDALKDKPMAKISGTDAGAWVAGLQSQPSGKGKKLSAKTAHNIFGTVSSVMKQALADGLVERNPFVGLGKGMRSNAPTMVCLEPAEFALIESELAAVEPLYAEFAAFLFWTGLRFGEATALVWDDIDYATSTVNVVKAWKRQEDNSYQVGEPKTKNGLRTVVLDEETIAALRARDPRLTALTRTAVAGAGQSLVFPNAVKGGRLSQSVFYQVYWLQAVGDARRRSGLTKLPRVHDLRHSHASFLLGNGVDILTVSRRLGHGSVAITGDVYGHVTANSNSRVLAAMKRGKGEAGLTLLAGGKNGKKKKHKKAS